MIQQISEEALRYAYQRVEDWIAVQRGQKDRAQALQTIFEGLGFGPDDREEFLDWQRKTIPEADDASTLVGLLIGLLIRQYDHDQYGL